MFLIQKVHDVKVPKTTSLTPLQNGHDFNTNSLFKFDTFGQIRANSILNIFFVDFSKQIIMIFIMYFNEI